jgi:hypothetical protein
MISRRNFISTAAAALTLSAVPALAAINTEEYNIHADKTARSWVTLHGKLLLRSEATEEQMVVLRELTGRCWFEILEDVMECEKECSGERIGRISYWRESGSANLWFYIEPKTRTLVINGYLRKRPWHENQHYGLYVDKHGNYSYRKG